ILERLTPGDLVVHIDHGVARYERMLRRGNHAEGEDRDYLELTFAGTDKIFVPVEQITRISRYSGAEHPQLSKLGGTEWLKTKQRLRKAVADLAEELLALYAARANAPGHAFASDTPWQGEMEASFPYEETPDQLRAVVEVKLDMEAGRPMDRLVVGDVGYGKTEVALREAFKAIQDGKQVAVLVPTTVLAAQHHQTFGQRFAAFPLKVRLLSRFVPPSEQKTTLAGLEDGSVDLVIGTHRLLSRDVKFRDLGLVVLVSSTLIQTGVDIPHANTIIIDRADTLGLAQLYQLRARVGRSSRRAYAFLLERRRERMSEEARKRLPAIFNPSELGAGF